MIAVFGLLVFAGCGGGGGGGGTPAPPDDGADGGGDASDSNYIVPGGAFTTEEVTMPPSPDETVVWPGDSGGVLSVAGQLDVTLKADITAAELREVKNLVDARNGEIVAQDVSTRGLLLELPTTQSAVALSEVLDAKSHVVSCAPNRVMESYEFVREQPRLPSNDYFIHRIRAQDAWTILRANDKQLGSQDVPIAVVDGGLDEALRSQLFANKDCTIYTQERTPTDGTGHGTAVASLAVASGDDGKAGVGIAWDAPLLMYDVLNDEGEAPGECTRAHIAAAISRAVDDGARIINVSQGPESGRATVSLAFRWNLGPEIKKAADNDRLVCFASGNQGTRCHDYWLSGVGRDEDSAEFQAYEAAYENNTLWVGATNGRFERWDSSTYGDKVLIYAPGVNVATQRGRHASFPPYEALTPDVVRASGTSYACPLVTGAAGLIWSLDTAQTGAEVRQVLLDTTNTSHDGLPILDLHAAVRQYLPNTRPTVEITGGPSGETTNASPEFTWSGEDDDGRIEQWESWIDDRDSGELEQWGRDDTTGVHRSLPTGQHTFYLRAKDNDSEWSETVSRSFEVRPNTGDAEIIVDWPGGEEPTAPTVNLTADDTAIQQGESTTLRWSSTNATSVSASDNFSPQDVEGSTTVSPTSTTTYEITVDGPGGQASDSVTVTVQTPSPEPTVTLEADDTTIQQGESTTLRWSSTNATSVSASDNFSPQDVEGSTTVSPTSTTTYEITVDGPGGQASDSVTVDVSEPDSGESIVGTWELTGFISYADGYPALEVTPDTGWYYRIDLREDHSCTLSTNIASYAFGDATTPTRVRLMLSDAIADRETEWSIEDATVTVGTNWEFALNDEGTVLTTHTAYDEYGIPHAAEVYKKQ